MAFCFGRTEDGRIDAEELARGLQKCGYRIEESETRQLLRDSEMDFGEWAAALIDWENVKGSNQWDEWARHAFELLKGDTVSGKEFGRAINQQAEWEGSFGKFTRALQEETGHDLNLYPSRAGNIDTGGGTVGGTRRGTVRAIDILEGRETLGRAPNSRHAPACYVPAACSPLSPEFLCPRVCLLL